jgi:hypothetical protein
VFLFFIQNQWPWWLPGRDMSQALTWLWHTVASSKPRGVLHWVMRPELYRRIPMVIQMARKLSTFFVIVIVNFIVGHTVYNTTLQLVLLIYWYRLVWATAKTVATSYIFLLWKRIKYHFTAEPPHYYYTNQKPLMWAFIWYPGGGLGPILEPKPSISPSWPSCSYQL